MSSNNRIPLVQPPYSPEVQKAFDIVMPIGSEPLQLFRAVANNPRALSRMMRGGLLDRGSISLRLRELMILRSCARCGCEYEWGVHVALFARAAKFSEAQLNDSVQLQLNVDLWAADELLVLRLADELHDRMHCSDSLWEQLIEAFQYDQVIELIMLAGSYHMVSYLANAGRIPLESFAPRFPTT